MRKINITGSELVSSCLCLGTYPFGLTMSEQDSFKLLDAFFDKGGNFFDSAHNYGIEVDGIGFESTSEKTIGKWAKDRGLRNNVIMGTKGCSIDTNTGEYESSKEEIVSQIDTSLKNLQTDHIDMYWLHRDDIKRPVEHFIDLLNEQVKLGKIRYFGGSNWTISRITKANHYAATSGQDGFIANQPWWSLAEPNKEGASDKTMVWFDRESHNFHVKSGMTLVPYSSQAKGFFAKIDKLGIENIPDSLKKLYLNGKNLETYKKIKNISINLGRSVNEIALSFILSQPYSTIPIIGCKSVFQINESVKAAEFVLDEKVLSELMPN